ncbi:MAG: radical SAM protein [Muribaculaceae bacterium]|nr:radical SAM protein [Muribaculaceae bacterium]
MKITFLVPPVLDRQRPAERSAGCTRVVYFAPNIYELTVIGVVEDLKMGEVAYEDFVFYKKKEEDFLQFLATDDSDIYCIWTVNLSIESDMLAIDSIFRLRPQARVIMMGPGPTYFIEKCLVDKRIVIVRGEPEATIVELLHALNEDKPLNNILGISWMNSEGNIVNNGFRTLIGDLDSLPLPARHFIANRRYFNPKIKRKGYTTAFTSRNCPYHCIYCVPSSLTFAREIENKRFTGRKPTISYRTAQSVDREMALLHEQGYKAIGFMDDNFIWNEERTRLMCEIMKKYGMLWGCQARVDAITEPIAKMLGESGCQYVDLGVESFNDEILKYVRKGITTEQIYEAIRLLKKYKVPVKLNVLIGSSPLETKETLRHTLKEAKKLKVDQVMFNIVSPFPGTEFYKLCKENNWLSTGDYVPTDVQRESILNLPNISSREMEKILFKNNLSYFLSWNFITTQLKRFTSWSEFSHAARALKVKLFG